MTKARGKPLGPGDVLEWSEGTNIHLWKVLGVYLGAMGQESLIEMESLTHQPGHIPHIVPAPFGMKTVFVPEVLTRDLTLRKAAKV